MSSDAVKILSFDEETLVLAAEVRLTAGRPARVTLAFPRIPEEKAAKLAHELAARPHFIASLLDRRLDPGSLDLIRRCGVPLFPASLSELSPASGCSCPAGLLPCKHVLAVLRSLARGIDADPFELFRLGGVDFAALLGREGVTIEAKPAEAALATTASILAWRLPVESAAFLKEGEEKGFEAVPLYRLEPMAESLVSLLEEETPLFPGGRAWFSRTWGRIMKAASARWQARGAKPEAWKAFERGPLGSYGPVVPRVGLFDDTLDFIRPVAPETAPRALSEHRTSGWLFEAMLSLGKDEARAHSAGLELWENLITVSLALMRAGAVAPVLVRHEREEGAACTILWEPALASTLVQEIVAAGAGAMEAAGIRLLDLPDALQAESTAEGRFVALLSVTITAFCDYLQEAAPPARQKLVPGLFLDRYRCLEVGACDAEIQGLGRYLRPLTFSQRTSAWRPAVAVRLVRGGEISLNLGVIPASGPAGRPVLLQKLLTEPAYEGVRYAFLSDFRLLSASYSPLSRVIETGGLSVKIPEAGLKDFLFSARPALELLGACVLLPKKLRKILRPSLVARISGGEGPGAERKLITKEMLSDFSWSPAVGERELTEAEFRELAAQKGEIVKLGDDYVWLDPEEIARIEKRLAEKKAPGYLERLRAVLSGGIDGARVIASEDVLEALRAMGREEEIPVPDLVQADLRPYQKRGFSWLVKNLRLGIGSLIADDMGLGKTLQVISAIAWLKAAGELAKQRVLVVVPATLLVNWKREVKRFTPAISCALYHGQDRELPAQKDLPDLLVTTYGTLRRDAALLAKRGWRLLVLDEAQAVKNTSTGVHGAVASLPAKQVIAMTGTPVENRLMEYWSIFSIIQPGVLGTAEEFRRGFVMPIEGEHDPEASDAFRRLVAPFMLRRLKSDRSIISDLPEKLVQDVACGLLPEQAALYRKTLEQALSDIASAEAEGEAAAPRRRALVLKLITQLKQICNSPSQFLKTTVADPDSAKAQMLLELLAECRENGRKAIVFTQYREMGERLQDWIGAKFGRRPEFLHGGVPVSRRSAMVDDFQENADTQVLLVSLKAGGVGLNLTAASVVIHYDLWWNPAVENQASDRAWRIGQQKNVLIQRFVTEGTFEERINALLTEKRQIAELAVGTGEKWLGDLSTRQIEDLFRLSGSDAV